MLPSEIKLKIVGKTAITTIDQKSLKAIVSPEQKDRLKNYVEKYNKKPLQFWYDKITKMFEVARPISKEKIAKKLAKSKKKTVTISMTEYHSLVINQKALALLVAKAAGEAIKNGADPYKAVEEATLKAEPVAKVGTHRPGEH